MHLEAVEPDDCGTSMQGIPEGGGAHPDEEDQCSNEADPSNNHARQHPIENNACITTTTFVMVMSQDSWSS